MSELQKKKPAGAGKPQSGGLWGGGTPQRWHTERSVTAWGGAHNKRRHEKNADAKSGAGGEDCHP